MATNLVQFRPSVVKVCAAPSPASENSRRKPFTAGGWLAPLFGFSSELNCIDSADAGSESPEKKDLSLCAKPSPRFAPGCFTEEKAKRLRRLTKESSFHDMYHSAIASRLASDFDDRSSDLFD